MDRSRVVQLQVAALIVVTVLVIGRTVWDSATSGDRSLRFDDLKASEHRVEAFELSDSTAITISATGSVVSRRSDENTMAAYGWLLDVASREPVWVMQREYVARVSGTLVDVDTSMVLAPGRYELHFAAYGPQMGAARRSTFFSRLFDDREHWMNDARRWQLSLEIDGDGPGLERIDADQAPNDTTSVWASGAMENRARAERLFRVTSSTTVLVDATGEIDADGSARDYGWIVDLAAGDTMWVLTGSNSMWAGGAEENRRAQEEVRLEEGIYEFGFTTDQRHAYRGWRANPPYDPSGWGMRVSHGEGPASTDTVRPFDPYSEGQPALALTRVGHDEDVRARFLVRDTVWVILDALGEIGRSRHDYGWLEDADGENVWEMTAARSAHAGGHSSNRRAIGMERLSPGEFSLRYRTDGSHAYGDWRHDPPEHEDRWGIALFVMNPADSALITEIEEPVEVQVEELRSADEDSVVVETGIAVDVSDGAVLADLTRLGNDADVSHTFSLDETTDVFVRAVGEITLNNPYDFGRIEHVGSGERVWEMTYDNTVPAGGANRNRLYEGVLKLPPGTYRVSFQTDFSHAFGDFASGEAPSSPEAWGIQVRRFDQ